MTLTRISTAKPSSTRRKRRLSIWRVGRASRSWHRITSTSRSAASPTSTCSSTATSDSSGPATSTPRRTRAFTFATPRAGSSCARRRTRTRAPWSRGQQGRAEVHAQNAGDALQQLLAAAVQRSVYYGLFGTHQYIVMFDRSDGIRFAHSPSAGGPPSATEVAWDWQFIIRRTTCSGSTATVRALSIASAVPGRRC